MTNDLSRRGFLAHSGTAVSAVWLSTHWPALLAVAGHAREAAQSSVPAKLEFFSADEATEIEAVTARILPTDDQPGAREAGTVYFIDRALATFARDEQSAYREGLPQLQARVQEVLPGVQKFSAATPEQQDKILHSFDEHEPSGGRAFRPGAGQNFFETVRVHTLIAFLIDPDSDSGGNRGGVGWKVIGREREHMFQPPFGYYDKDYPGWKPAPQGSEKTKS